MTLASSLAAAPCWASLGDPSRIDLTETQAFAATNALVLDQKTGRPICQVSVVGHPERVPARLIQAAEEGPSESFFNQFPECGASELAAVQWAAQHGQASTQTAILVPTLGVLALTCTVGVLAGFNAVWAYETMITGLRHLKKSVLKEDMAAGALAGAAADGVVVGSAELLTGFEMASMLATLGSSGVGLICGGAGGIGTFMVAYFARRSANSQKQVENGHGR